MRKTPFWAAYRMTQTTRNLGTAAKVAGCIVLHTSRAKRGHALSYHYLHRLGIAGLYHVNAGRHTGQ